MNRILLAPISRRAGITSVLLGIYHGLERTGARVGLMKPISPVEDGNEDRTIGIARQMLGLDHPDPISLSEAHRLLDDDGEDGLMERVIGFQQAVADDVDIQLIEGVAPDNAGDYAGPVNAALARNLGAQVIFVAAPAGETPERLARHLGLVARAFEKRHVPVLGCILNKVGAPEVERLQVASAHAVHTSLRNCGDYVDSLPALVEEIPLIGCIPWQTKLIAPRVADVVASLTLDVLEAGHMQHRRVRHILMVARTVPNMLYGLEPGALVIVPGDREDILRACALAERNGSDLAGVLLTGGLQPDEGVHRLCATAFDSGLALLSTPWNTYTTANRVARMDVGLPRNDKARIEHTMEFVASHVDADRLLDNIHVSPEMHLSPAAFRYRLVQQARVAGKMIVLPEGDEPRTLEAACTCHEKGIAKCVLLAKESRVRHLAEARKLTLPADLEIIDPDSIRDRYISPMVALRRHKGLTSQMAEAQLEDNVVLGTMMLAADEVDGLVSGAVHTTANTVRPALQLIKTAPGARLVSSVFFMCLPDQVVVYGDCAINPDPDAEALADIAIQSADSASLFGIEPRVAMLSYSTGDSGKGADVEKVREATRLVREQRPDILVDGPLQYDAAANRDVAKTKAPHSKVAGRATVFVFPDLNTGNTTYKAVQRSAGVISIGPMLQGLKKPVNDLSRGALVDDIVYTIAITALQATQKASG
ncbi:phosphate acetyltransferase [Thiolapillus sp.]|uniref:phosphate acetyltransferase n=1 Tax=Thiolapillus sp. TaxID=2017437 RepID=UPI003AF47147